MTNKWIDSRTHREARRYLPGGPAQVCLTHAPDAVIISSNPALHVPNFDKCRRDNFCRCRTCKPAMALANGN